MTAKDKYIEQLKAALQEIATLTPWVGSSYASEYGEGYDTARGRDADIANAALKLEAPKAPCYLCNDSGKTLRYSFTECVDTRSRRETTMSDTTSNANVEWTLKPKDVQRPMNWSQKHPDGTRVYPDKPDIEVIFEPDAALAHLLINNVIFINDHWWEKTWPEAAQKTFYMGVNCNDTFAWASADSEELLFEDIESLYKMWIKDPSNGADIWCIIRRKELPQAPVEQMIRKAGVWDLDALIKEHDLQPNGYEVWCKEQVNKRKTNES